MFCSWDCLVDRHLLLCRISFTQFTQVHSCSLCTALLRTMLNWLLTSPRRGVRNELGCQQLLSKKPFWLLSNEHLPSHPISSHLIPSPYWIVIFHMLHLAMPKYAKCESKERSSSHLACEFYSSDMWKIRLRRFRGSSICDRPLQCMVNLARLNSQNLFNLPSGYLT